MNNFTLKRPLRILVVEDDELIQAAFCLLVQSFEGVELAGKASTGVEAVEQARLRKPDLILMDLRMPDMDGVEATKLIKAVQPKIKVIALTALEDPLEITRALEEGLDGFLLKRASPRELTLAIETVVAGEQYLSPQVSAIIAKAYLDERSRKHAPAPLLTPREKQVVTRIADGMRVKHIAEKMEISERTVEKHCEQARRKLKAATTAEMVAIWQRTE
ncbi:MAG: response regulator transcription factor [Desulfuromonadaceae bacterium]